MRLVAVCDVGGAEKERGAAPPCGAPLRVRRRRWRRRPPPLRRAAEAGPRCPPHPIAFELSPPCPGRDVGGESSESGRSRTGPRAASPEILHLPPLHGVIIVAASTHSRLVPGGAARATEKVRWPPAPRPDCRRTSPARSHDADVAAPQSPTASPPSLVFLRLIWRSSSTSASSAALAVADRTPSASSSAAPRHQPGATRRRVRHLGSRAARRRSSCASAPDRGCADARHSIRRSAARHELGSATRLGTGRLGTSSARHGPARARARHSAAHVQPTSNNIPPAQVCLRRAPEEGSRRLGTASGPWDHRHRVSPCSGMVPDGTAAFRGAAALDARAAAPPMG